jgi:chromosome segregation ATPase
MDSQNNRFETLKDIFKDVKNILEKINNYGFFQRLFAWKKLLKEDSTKLDSKLDDLQDIIGDLRVKFNRLDDYDEVKTENETLKKKITTIETTSDNNKKELDKKRIQYDTMTTNIENRERKKEEQEEIERDELEAERKKTWQGHETNVSEFIRRECVKYDIQYVGPQVFFYQENPEVQHTVYHISHILFE